MNLNFRISVSVDLQGFLDPKNALPGDHAFKSVRNNNGETGRFHVGNNGQARKFARGAVKHAVINVLQTFVHNSILQHFP